MMPKNKRNDTSFYNQVITVSALITIREGLLKPPILMHSWGGLTQATHSYALLGRTYSSHPFFCTFGEDLLKPPILMHFWGRLYTLNRPSDVLSEMSRHVQVVILKVCIFGSGIMVTCILSTCTLATSVSKSLICNWVFNKVWIFCAYHLLCSLIPRWAGLGMRQYGSVYLNIAHIPLVLTALHKHKLCG